MPILEMRLLGDFSLRHGDAPVVTINTARLQALLAYLILHHDAPQPRHHVAYLFWPDATEVQARNNLRQLLHQLRHALPEADRFLSADPSSVRWRADAPFSLDVGLFEHLLAEAAAESVPRGVPDREARRSSLEQAVGLYAADLLPSCYDDWIVPERDRLRQKYLGALTALVRLLEGQREYEPAIQYARRWLRHDPLAESGYRALIRLLAVTDDRAGAVRVYRTCAETLRRELGTEPGPATRDLYQRLSRAVQLPAARAGAPAPTPTAFVGRAREWEQLLGAWRQVSAGGPRFVLVSGEAGIGKSRLAEELLAWAQRLGIAVAKTRSYPVEGQLSLAPVTDWLRSAGVRSQLTRLDPVWLTEIARILPELLAEHRELPRPEPIAEYGQRQRFFEALVRALLAAPQPLLALIDDLQWCDQETLEWLHFLLRFDPAARLLIVGCVRAEDLPARHPLRTFLVHLGTAAGAEIALGPLDAAETAALAGQVGGRELDHEAALRMFRATEGIPLFVVETVRAGLGHAPDGVREAHAESPRFRERPPGADRPPLPPRAYAVIADRLTKLLPPARALLGLAAVIGHAFTLDILLAAGNSDEESAVGALDELWTKRIIREQGLNGYDFTHDKLREVAYAEISAPQRRLYHRRIAQALESIYAGDLDPVSGEIASHYERAGMAEQAIPHYQRAAAVAQHVYANDDAIGLLSRGLALLASLPGGMKRDRQELGLLLALGPALRVAKGWAAPELERALDRAQALCDKLGDDAQRWQVLCGLQSLCVVQAKLERTQYLWEELDTLYQRAHGAPPPRFFAVMRTGARLHLGHIQDAAALFAAITASHDPDQLRRLEEAQGVNYMVLAQSWQSHALWCLGYPLSAQSRGHDAVTLARDLAQPFNQALATAYLAMLMQFRADEATARAHAEEALALAGECKAPYYRAWSSILAAYARAWERPDEEHLARLRETIEAFTAAGARLRLPFYLALLAQVYGKAGHVNDGLLAIDEALAASRAHNEHWWDAELHRLRGELLLAQGAETRDGEAALLRALEIARSQQARSLELRAATSLARVWGARQRADEGRRLLSDICAWFTEGQETPDMRAARTILAQLD